MTLQILTHVLSHPLAARDVTLNGTHIIPKLPADALPEVRELNLQAETLAILYRQRVDAFMKGVERPQQLPRQQQQQVTQQTPSAQKEPDIAFHSMASETERDQELEGLRRQVALLQRQAASTQQ